MSRRLFNGQFKNYYSNADVVYTYMSTGQILTDLYEFQDMAFGVLWIEAAEFEDPDARSFALNALADTVDWRRVTVTYNPNQGLAQMAGALTNLGTKESP